MVRWSTPNRLFPDPQGQRDVAHHCAPGSPQPLVRAATPNRKPPFWRAFPFSTKISHAATGRFPGFRSSRSTPSHGLSTTVTYRERSRLQWRDRAGLAAESRSPDFPITPGRGRGHLELYSVFNCVFSVAHGATGGKRASCLTRKVLELESLPHNKKVSKGNQPAPSRKEGHFMDLKGAGRVPLTSNKKPGAPQESGDPGLVESTTSVLQRISWPSHPMTRKAS